MALTLNSPGVFLQENDNSQITQGPVTVGAALVGPTVQGPVNIPTVVTSYSQFKNIFGSIFSDESGSTQEYLTSIAAYNYFQQGGESLLVSRVVSGTYAPAVAYVENLDSISGSTDTTGSKEFSTGSVAKYFTGSLTDYITEIEKKSSFILETLSQGEVNNSFAVESDLASFLLLASASANQVVVGTPNEVASASNYLAALNAFHSSNAQAAHYVSYGTQSQVYLNTLVSSSFSATYTSSISGTVGTGTTLSTTNNWNSFVAAYNDSTGSGINTGSFTGSVTYTATSSIVNIYGPVTYTGSYYISASTAYITGSNGTASVAAPKFTLMFTGSYVFTKLMSASDSSVTVTNLTNLSVPATASTALVSLNSTTSNLGTTSSIKVANTSQDASGKSFNQSFLSLGSGSLVSGSANNVRWEITAASTASGMFSLAIRQGNDYNNKKSVVETWANLSLDPNTPNYIEYVIGNQSFTPATDSNGNWYLKQDGSYPNKSKYVRVKSVSKPTPNYLDSLGKARAEYTASIPVIGSGSLMGTFTTATGKSSIYQNGTSSLFEHIPTVNTYQDQKIQGVLLSDYTASIGLLADKDSYAYNVIFTPGLTLQNASSIVSTVVANTQERGDAIAVIDTVGYGVVNNDTVVEYAQAIDSSYAATYYPWLQLRSNETGKLVWAPASTVIPSAYEYNDRVGQPWFAPAGINRGALPTVVTPERRLTTADRDTLYSGKVNPIAVFPGQGTVIYGQKTLQTAASALDRVNVRRLLIELKANINQISANLLFEPNTIATRNSFLNQVNPYLSYVQQKQGLYAFQVVMDETNNTADVIDRNQLVGAIYLQPTKTSEFIIVDFNITPTGATFGA